MTDDEIAAIKARYELAREAASDSFSLSLLEDAIEDVPTLLAEVERLREELYEERLTVATVVSLKAMEERLEKENDVLRRQARKASRSRDAVVRMREKLLAEVERLREENRHHRVTATNSVSKSLHDAAIAEQAAEIARLHQAHETACEGGDLLREEIERLTRERDEARADAAALRRAREHAASDPDAAAEDAGRSYYADRARAGREAALEGGR